MLNWLCSSQNHYAYILYTFSPWEDVPVLHFFFPINLQSTVAGPRGEPGLQGAPVSFVFIYNYIETTHIRLCNVEHATVNRIARSSRKISQTLYFCWRSLCCASLPSLSQPQPLHSLDVQPTHFLKVMCKVRPTPQSIKLQWWHSWGSTYPVVTWQKVMNGNMIAWYNMSSRKKWVFLVMVCLRSDLHIPQGQSWKFTYSHKNCS